MAIVDVTNPLDLPRLIAAANEARKRDAFLPTWSELAPALQEAMRRQGEVVEKLAPVFGAQIGRSMEVLRTVLAEKYGETYAADVWHRLGMKRQA